jgi:hypothetical protein
MLTTTSSYFKTGALSVSLSEVKLSVLETVKFIAKVLLLISWLLTDWNINRPEINIDAKVVIVFMAVNFKF